MYVATTCMGEGNVLGCGTRLLQSKDEGTATDQIRDAVTRGPFWVPNTLSELVWTTHRNLEVGICSRNVIKMHRLEGLQV